MLNPKSSFMIAIEEMISSGSASPMLWQDSADITSTMCELSFQSIKWDYRFCPMEFDAQQGLYQALRSLVRCCDRFTQDTVGS